MPGRSARGNAHGRPEMKNVATDLGGEGLRRDAGLSYAPGMPSQPTGAARPPTRAWSAAAACSAVGGRQFSVVMHPGLEAELAQARPAAVMPTEQTHRVPANHSVPCRRNRSPDGWRRARETHRESRVVDSASWSRGAGHRVNCDGHAHCPTMRVNEHMDVCGVSCGGPPACGEQAENVEGCDGAQRATYAAVRSGGRRKHRRRLRPDGRLDGSRYMSVRFDLGRAKAYRAVGSRPKRRARVGSVSGGARDVSRLGRTTGWAERA